MNQEVLKDYIEKYKKGFAEHWENERYKWECVKCFQDNWDINAENFYEMFTKATDKAFNLLTSMNNFPRGMIQIYAEQDQETVRNMFFNLFDESKDVAERVIKFQSDSQEICDRLSPGKQHYQRAMAITVYLWMRFPEKYDIFKYSLCKETALLLENDFVPKKGRTAENINGNQKQNDEILAVIVQDTELIELYNRLMDGNCYQDKVGRLLAADFTHYISVYLKDENEAKKGKEANILDEPTVKIEAFDGVEPTGFWWLSASPKIWSYSEINVGEEQFYTLYNDNGNKRHIFANFLEAKAGDMIIGYESNPVKKVVALGRIIRENDGENIYFEKTESLESPIDYKILKDCPELEKMEFFQNPNGSLFKLTKEEYEFIMDVIRDENPAPESQNRNKLKNAEVKPYTKEDFLSEVYMDESQYESLKNILMKKQNIILQGAPGVGKTFAAKRLAYSIMGVEDKNRVELIQFHQNYSYEDFIMGYKPNGEGFELRNGIFYKFCQKASNNPELPYFFIIDEINRGNMSKIFGELLMLIEKDYRGTTATLAYNGLPFSVPKNLYIIGMMNTADRSLAMIDYALRRRFSFYAMEPGFESDGFKAYQATLDDDTFNDLIKMVINLNKTITDDPSLGKGFCIGHSYFCGQKPAEEEELLGWMTSVVDYDIVPMLEEYWFDEPEKINKWRAALQGVFNS